MKIEIHETTRLFKLLGNETQLTILKILKYRTCCVYEFVELFNVSQPSISQLKKDRASGFIIL